MPRFFIIMIAAVLIAGCGSPQSESRKSSKTDPRSVQNKYLNEGIQHLQAANAVEAIKSFDRAIKQNPMDTRGYIILGQTYMRMNNYPRAIDTLSAASEITPDQGEIYYLMAVNHRLSGDKDLARENAQRSIELFRRAKDEENFKKSLVFLKDLVDSQ